jgi:hypothetical protein
MIDLPIPDDLDDITSEWVSSVLDAEVASVDVTPVSTGFISTTLRVVVGFEKPRADLPGSLIVKLPHRGTRMRSLFEALGLYSREVGFYRDIGPEFGEVIPRCFFAAHSPDTGRSAIVMEDAIASRGLRVGDNVAGCTFEEAAAAMRVAARWHAHWWNDPSLDGFAWLATPASVEPDPVRAVTQAWSRYPAGFRALMSPATVATVELYGPRAMLVAERMSLEPWTLTHGDYRLDNLMFGPNSEVVAFDWQLVARGQGPRDAAFLALFTPVDGKPIVDSWQPLLDAYYSELTNSGVDYSREAFTQETRLNSFHGFQLAVTSLANLDFSDPRARSLASNSLERMNGMVELLDLPELLRQEFPAPDSPGAPV